MAINCICNQRMIVAEEDQPVAMHMAENGKTSSLQASEVEVVKVQEKDYEKLLNLPQINSVRLIGNRSLDEIGVEEAAPIITELEIREVLRIAKGGQ